MMLPTFGVTLPVNAGDGPAKAAAPFDVLQAATLLVSSFIIAVAVLTNVGIVGHPSELVDAFAVAALIGVFGLAPQLGARAQVAANTAGVLAAHARLDAAHIPPAADGVLPPNVPLDSTVLP